MISRKDLCNGDKVKSIKALPSNSASPSDTWIVNYKEEMALNYRLFNLTITYEKAFVKVFFTDGDNTFMYSEYGAATWALKYEGEFYTQITNPLVLSGMCPYFVTCYGMSTECRWYNILGMLQDKLEGATLSETQLENNLERNAVFMLFPDAGERPALSTTDDKIFKRLPRTELHSYKYGMIMTQEMSDAVPYYNWLNSRAKSDMESEVGIDILLVLFQIAIACYALYLSGATHNDLHNGNIFVKETNPPKPVIYEIGGEIYRFTTEWVPYLYDFDRSYAESLGENIFLDEADDYKVSFQNRIAPNRDFIKSCCHLVRSSRVWNKFVKSVICHPGHEDKFERVLDRRCNMVAEDGDEFPVEWFDEHFNPMPVIIDALYKEYIRLSGSQSEERVDPADLHFLNPKLFADKGRRHKLNFDVKESIAYLSELQTKYAKM